MRVACLLFGIFVAGVGCDDRSLVEQLLRGRGGGDQGGPIAAPPPDAVVDAGVAADGATGGGGQGGSPGVACGPLSLSSTIVLAPAAAGQSYVRCQTLGPETSWQVVLVADGRPARGADRRGDLAPPRHRHLDRARAARSAAGGDRRGRLLARRRDAGDALGGDGRGRALERARRDAPAQLHQTPPRASIPTPRRWRSPPTVVAWRRRWGWSSISPAGPRPAGDAPQTHLRSIPKISASAPGGNRIPLIRFVAADKRLLSRPTIRPEILRPARGSRCAIPRPGPGRPLRLLQSWSPRATRSRRTGAQWRGRRRPKRAAKDSPPALPSSTRPAATRARVRSRLRRLGARLLARQRAALHRDRHRRPGGRASDLHPIQSIRRAAGITFLGVSPGRRAGRLGVGDDLLVEPGHGRDRRELELFARRRDLVGGRTLRRRHRRSVRAVSLLAGVR